MEMYEVNTILQHKGKIERGGKEVRTLVHTLDAHEEVAVKMVAVFLFGIATRCDDLL